MNKIFEKPELFDWICSFASLAFLSISIYLFSKSHYIFAILSIILAVWALTIVVARIIIGWAYVEGQIVRLLIKSGNKMKESDLNKYYEQYGSIDIAVARLKDRGVIKVEDGSIQLIEDEIGKGFKNNLMIWGTRRVKI